MLDTNIIIIIITSVLFILYSFHIINKLFPGGMCVLFVCTPGAQIANAKFLKNQNPDRIIQQLESTIMDFPGEAQRETNKADSFPKKTPKQKR